MTDPSQRRVDADIEKSMGLFQRADVGHLADIESRIPSRVLLALDGSAQDHALVMLAKQLYERIKCKIGYHPAPSEAFKVDGESFATLESIGATPVEIEPGFQNNYDEILAAVDSFEADLLIAPCPFGRDFHSLGEDSTGTVVDVLTARIKIPFIAIRRPDAIGRDPTMHLRIILTGENPAAEMAVRWAIGLLQPGGRLELLLLVEQSFYENFRNVMAELQPGTEVRYDDLENALAKYYAKLHASLQQTSRKLGVTYELLVRYEADEKPITPEHPTTHPALMVLGLERNSHDSRGQVHDFIRRSPHPVLVVSVG